VPPAACAATNPASPGRVAVRPNGHSPASNPADLMHPKPGAAFIAGVVCVADKPTKPVTMPPKSQSCSRTSTRDSFGNECSAVWPARTVQSVEAKGLVAVLVSFRTLSQNASPYHPPPAPRQTPQAPEESPCVQTATHPQATPPTSCIQNPAPRSSSASSAWRTNQRNRSQCRPCCQCCGCRCSLRASQPGGRRRLAWIAGVPTLQSSRIPASQPPGLRLPTSQPRRLSSSPSWWCV
jgi:hypothetical protein